MKTLLKIALLALSFVALPRHARANIGTSDDPIYVVPTSTSANAAVPASSINSPPIISTMACAGTATLVAPTNTLAVGTCFRNEDASVAVRIGGSGVTSTIGYYVGPGGSFCMDAPPYYYRAALYCASTGATVATSLIRVKP